jgi:outer membrane protein OmpA-like peptidoglycan-associated protein
MKNKLLIIAAFTFTGISFINTTTIGQIKKMSSNSNKSDSFIAVNLGSKYSSNSISINGQRTSEDLDFESEKVKVSSKAMYMASEQYVFDNLSSLKRSFTTSDIYFDLDDASIRPDALPALNSLVILLKENPGVSVAVTAFSDSRMSKYNEKLASDRAQSATTYLISKGISANRLVIEKHGRPDMSNPCNSDPNCSLSLQQINRRTEFNILFNGVNLGQIN